MALETHADLEKQYRLFTAVGFGMEKPNADVLLDSARQSAYAGPIERDATISLNGHGSAVIDSTVNGKTQPETTVDFDNAKKQVFPLGKSYDVATNQAGTKADGHVLLTMAMIGNETGFHITAEGKKIDGTCTVKDNQTQCHETIKDGQGNVVLEAQSHSNINTSPNNFTNNTDYFDAAHKYLGHVELTVAYDDKTSTVKAHSKMTR